MPGQDRGTITLTGPDAAARAQALATAINALGTVRPSPDPAVFEQLRKDLETPNGPLARFIFMNAGATGADVRVSYRCWPEPRYTEVRDSITRLANSFGPATVTFVPSPFPAMVVPEREARAIARFLRTSAPVTTLHAAIPFNSEDYALFLGRIPGTYTFLGVRKPGSAIDTAYPHMPGFNPDERAIGIDVRAMAHWLSQRT